MERLQANGQLQNLINETEKRHEILSEIARRLEWPPLWHLPSRIISEITKKSKTNELTDKDIKKLLLSFYSFEFIQGLTDSWNNSPHIERRMPILEEAAENHYEGRYFSSVCTLLPQIEGILGDYLGKKLNPNNDVERVFAKAKTVFQSYAENFLKDVVYKTEKWGSSTTQISRHAILHGYALNYGTLENSIKAFIIVDLVIQCCSENPSEEITEST